MFCPNCGIEVAADASFCRNCGRQLAASTPAAISRPQTPQQADTSGPKDKINCFTVGCLGLVGLFLLGTLVVGITSNHSSENPAPRPTQIISSHKVSSTAVKPTAEPTATPDPCDVATDFEKKSVDAINNGEYQSAYDLAVKGITANDDCESDDASLVNSGYLLSMKGLAEHNLPQGDSRTDLNQANQLLVECQTQPGLYGTSTAASCETQEQNNISAQTNWDIGQ